MPEFLAENRRARFDYEIEETKEAGLELLGIEVKSVKNGKIDLSGSYVIVRGGEAWLVNAKVPPYQPGNAPQDYDPERNRRVLLKKEEIQELTGKLSQKGYALLPLRVYLKKNIVKLALGLGRSKKKTDKREAIKKRDLERETGRKF
jgi:SsrA-binding protein